MSRKITADAMQNLFAFRTFKRDNTHVKITAHYEAEMYLHNNNIAILMPNNRRLYIRNAGWFSVTTKERLNGILGRTPFYIRQKDFKWDIMRTSTDEIVLHDWDGEWFTIEENEIYN